MFKVPWGFVLASFYWYVLVGACQSLNGPLGQALSNRPGFPATFEKYLATIFFIGSTTTVLIRMIWVKKDRPLITMGAAALSQIIGTLAIALGPTWWVMCTGVAIAGIGYGILTVWLNAEFARIFAKHATGAWLNVLNGFWGVGAICGAYAFSQTANQPKTAHLSLAILATIGLLGAAAIIRYLSQPTETEAEEAATQANLPQHLPAHATLMVLYIILEVGLATYLVRYVVEVWQWQKATGAAQLSQIWLAFTLSRFATGMIAARFKESTVLIASILGMIAAYATIASGSVAAGTLLLGASMAPVFSSILAIATRDTLAKARTTAAVLVCGNFAAISAPTVVELPLGSNMRPLPYALMGGAVVMLLVLGYLLRQRSPEAAA